jgi:CBS domain containing-hemolysin-like protein
MPKTLGATYWKIIAPVGAYVLLGLIYGLWPFVKISQLITSIFTKNNNIETVSKNELELMTDMIEKEGNIRSDESKIIKNLLKFSDILTEDVMTPRTVVNMADENTTIKELYEANTAKHFSRIPIFSENKDNVTGYVLKDEILLKIIKGRGEEKLADHKIEIIQVHEELPLPELYEKLTSSNQHIAIVVDEYDGLAGIVTMEDVIETLLGIEITDETDQIEDLQKFARKNWEYRAKKLGILAEDFDHEEDEKED